jgi:anti-sigma factor RsiW
MNEACRKWAEAITRLVDGELEASERAALELHVGACDHCRAALQAQQAERARWRDALALNSDPADRAAIVAAARAHLRAAPRWRRWLRTRSREDVVAGVSLAAVVILVVVLGQWRASPPSSWAPSSPAEYYPSERADVDPTEIPRPF